MDKDWQTRYVEEFCQKNDVVVILEDEWKTREMKVVMKKGKWSVVRHICYDSLSCLLPSVLLNEMFKEIPADKEGDNET